MGGEDDVRISREDIDKLATCHVCPHGVVESHGGFRGCRRSGYGDEQVGGIGDAVLEDESLCILLDVWDAGTRGEDVHVAVEQFQLEEGFDRRQGAGGHIVEPLGHLRVGVPYVGIGI